MTGTILDFVGAVFVFIGAVLSFGAAVALVRFPDVLGKLHAITKPQVLGLIFVSLGVAVSLRTWSVVGLCLLIIALQLLTSPVSASLVSRSAYRSGLFHERDLLVNHLSEDLEDAGFTHRD